MKKLIFVLTVSILLSASIALACGFKTLPPLMPLGCTTQWAVCIDGQWVWVCR